jgi:hypothetical protein
MSSRKIEVESMTNLTRNSLVRLATVVYIFIQYPHKKLQSQRVHCNTNLTDPSSNPGAGTIKQTVNPSLIGKSGITSAITLATCN